MLALCAPRLVSLFSAYPGSSFRCRLHVVTREPRRVAAAVAVDRKVVRVEFVRFHLLQTFCDIFLAVCTMNDENRFPCLTICLVARCLTDSVWKVLPQNVCQKGATWLFKARDLASKRSFSNDAFRLYDPLFFVRKLMFTNRHFNFTIHPSLSGSLFAAAHISTLRSCLR